MAVLLVTGSRGMVGQPLVDLLTVAGHQVRSFDLADGDDVRDESAVSAATAGCDTVIHLAAADDPAPADVIIDTIMSGTKNVLEAAVTQCVPRVVMVSSVDALACSWVRPPIWEYGAWIHVDDLAHAICAAASCPPPPTRFACHLIAAADINSDDFTSRELISRVHPDVPWRGDALYADDPTRSLVNCEAARATLNWQPQISWRSRPSPAG